MGTGPLSGKNEVMKFLRKYRLEIVVFIFGFMAINGIFVLNGFHEFKTSDAEYAEHFGAFIGGYFGSIFSLAAMVLLIATLRGQLLAYKDQNLASAQQDFETKYFELIKLHRDNVTEIGMKGDSGRRFFVLLLREFRCALEIIAPITSNLGFDLSQWQLLHIAYYCVFFGVGPNSSRMLRLSLSTFDSTLVDAIEMELNKYETKARVREQRKFVFLPFEGHQSRLGHYYRHLYHMITYVDKAVPQLKIDKYQYVKTIRAQLSTHEQALLLINSLTPIGQVWWSNDLIVKYGMVKNISRGFFDATTEFDPRELFPAGYFEWEEPKTALPDIGPWKK